MGSIRQATAGFVPVRSRRDSVGVCRRCWWPRRRPRAASPIAAMRTSSAAGSFLLTAARSKACTSSRSTPAGATKRSWTRQAHSSDRSRAAHEPRHAARVQRFHGAALSHERRRARRRRTKCADAHRAAATALANSRRRVRWPRSARSIRPRDDTLRRRHGILAVTKRGRSIGRAVSWVADSFPVRVAFRHERGDPFISATDSVRFWAMAMEPRAAAGAIAIPPGIVRGDRRRR